MDEVPTHLISCRAEMVSSVRLSYLLVEEVVRDHSLGDKAQVHGPALADMWRLYASLNGGSASSQPRGKG